ncbi:DNA-binding FadR family transcriptional regulator [Maritalea mobilis]|uniref:DNA-binding FadR family transcriptional regulator n=1 Tax=Maritalea mobilis TaxID=483324 RepID=A0A4R6VTM2_9HYPH|nr:FCD domain-containing protein [Maritalea mobilis]TDQ66034.1 DNA-binding FadR family transcriptional regulator [Maritalea mobilis]
MSAIDQKPNQDAVSEEGASKTSAVDRAVEQIRGLIAERELTIGDALPTERELSEQFQIGRNTVREAMQVLRAFGIIETRPKVGAVICGGQSEALKRLFSFHQGISPESFRDLQDYRRIIEIGVGDRILMKAKDEDIDHLSTINARMLSSKTAEDAARHDFEFHEALVALSGNRTTVAAYRMMRPVIEEIMLIGKTERPTQSATYEAHEEIIGALRERDRIAYAYLVSRHLEFGLRFVVKT